MARLFFITGALLAGLSVGMGAYGTHTSIFDEVQALWVEKGSRYQMYHALGLLFTSWVIVGSRTFQGQAVAAGFCFLGGILFFSGSLYLMAFFTLDLGYVTPFGGLLFMAGWLLLALAGPGTAKKGR
jgi:uncharacterized membrane protein YgdD (TMEM256/DUF423 family)